MTGVQTCALPIWSGGFSGVEQRAVFLAVSTEKTVFLLAVFGAVFSKLKIKLDYGL